MYYIVHVNTKGQLEISVIAKTPHYAPSVLTASSHFGTVFAHYGPQTHVTFQAID